MPSARTWTTLQAAACSVRHTEVLNAVTRLEVESSNSDPDLCAHLGTVVHCGVVRVQLMLSLAMELFLLIQ